MECIRHPLPGERSLPTLVRVPWLAWLEKRREGTLIRAVVRADASWLVRTGTYVAALTGLLWAGLTNYLFFHAAVEGFSVVVAALVYVLASCTYRYTNDDLLLFIGQAHVVIAALDFLHLLSYQGMEVLAASCPNTPAQLWIVGRYLSGLAFLALPFFINRRIPHPLILAGLVALASLFLWAIFVGKIFPSCFAPPVGTTRFRILSELAIIAMVATGAVLLRARRAQVDAALYRSLMVAAACIVGSELCFTARYDAHGVVNIVGHILKLAAYNALLQGVVMKGLKQPFDSIFAKLQASAVRDPLTGVYNRHGFRLAAQHEMNAASQRGSGVATLMADLDNFKRVNDTFGHQAGDEVLKQFASILTASVKPTDTVARLGGDEFVVLLPGAGLDEAQAVADRIKRSTRAWIQSARIAAGIDVSVGVVVWSPSMRADIDALVHEADEAMYAEKEAKRGGRKR